MASPRTAGASTPSIPHHHHLLPHSAAASGADSPTSPSTIIPPAPPIARPYRSASVLPFDHYPPHTTPASGPVSHLSPAAAPDSAASPAAGRSTLAPPGHDDLPDYRPGRSLSAATSASPRSGANPPRKSSLLPAAHFQASPLESQQSTFDPPIFRNPFDARTTLSPPASEGLHGLGPGPSFQQHQYQQQHEQQHQRPSVLAPRTSKSSSANTGVRNVNRWSASTASTFASPSQPSSHSRHVSIDSTLLFGQNNPALETSPSPDRHLRRASSSSSIRDYGRVDRGDSETAPSLPPLASLPPIATLPSLEHELSQPAVPETSWDFTGLPRGDRASSSAIIPPAAEPVSASVHSRNQSTASSALSGPKMLYGDQNGAAFKGHNRRRSDKGSGESTRSRDRKQPSQKAMLSKALQKANTAVQLDNAQNLEGAREAYLEACSLLQHVLVRTAGDNDKRKLEAIRATYTSRIDELNQLLPVWPTDDEKALPHRPESQDFMYGIDDQPSEDEGTYEAAGHSSRLGDRPESRQTPTPAQNYSQPTLQSAFSRTPQRSRNHKGLGLQVTSDDPHAPPPLSPGRPTGHSRSPGNSQDLMLDSRFAAERTHHNEFSHEPATWLDPIDESEGSVASSMRSRTSSFNAAKHYLRAPSGNTEAEFDAALDDAIEAAWDGLSHDDPRSGSIQHGVSTETDDDEEVVAQAMKKVKLARERVRQSEMEAMELANERERRLRQQLEGDEYGNGGAFYDGNDSEEEEQMLEEMTSGYLSDDPPTAHTTMSPPARRLRESDSSEKTNSTWHSSMGSNPTTATTMLSTVTENTEVPAMPSDPAPAPPPTSALPLLPHERPGSSASGRHPAPPSKGRKLTIETSVTSNPYNRARDTPPPQTASNSPVLATHDIPPKAAALMGHAQQSLSATSSQPPSSIASRQGPSPLSGVSPAEGVPPTPPLPHGRNDARSASPAGVRPPLKKNFSSSSLRSMRSRNVSHSNLDDTLEHVPGTSSAGHYHTATPKLPAIPSVPTPLTTAFKEKLNIGGSGGMYLFESDFHSAEAPGAPNADYPDAPAPLEPCPTDFPLRPFWLMRCLYQTLSHPRGGYLSNKLFVPSDVWRVKGVKLKSLDDKMAQCDLLTAALQKLSRVDTCDADAVLDEMQAFEAILEQVQTALARRLGNEVGVQAPATLFKDASTTDMAGNEVASSGARSGSVSTTSKSSSFSWRRLRSKNSSAGMGREYRKGSVSHAADSGETSGPGPALPSLPMTPIPTTKPAKRDVASVAFTGPYAGYMNSLARLFDAAQAVDQVARQVEDPGLRHADKTQVGLELCTRHAAEFFGFYICRFVMSDLTLLMDKYLKRSSEWVCS